MARSPFQVLILPYRRVVNEQSIQFEYALFSRYDYPCWQFIAGGAEDDESPLQAAQREAFEEGRIASTCPYMALETMASIPVHHFRESYRWGESLYVVPEYSFAVDVSTAKLHLSYEHNEFAWLAYAEAYARLTYDSNKTALWELNQKLLGKGPRN